ncbi:MAG: hypothetical protein Q4G33_06440 [bacterium]|nr:hypothetical protein [bacterium]
MTEKRKMEILNACNEYAETAINNSVKSAQSLFWYDYVRGRRWSFIEHIVIMKLTQVYIDCKCGAIDRKTAARNQNMIFKDFFDAPAEAPA